MGSDLKKAGRANKFLCVGCIAGAVASFVWVHWILGVILLVGAGYFFFGLLKDYAASGKRF